MNKLGFSDLHIPVSKLPREIQERVIGYIKNQDFPGAKRIRDEWEQKITRKTPGPTPRAPTA